MWTPKLAGPALWSTYSVAGWKPSPGAEGFANLYTPDNYGSWTYDAIGVLAAAIDRRSTDPDKIRAAILSTKGYKDGSEGESISSVWFGDGLRGYNIVRNRKGCACFDKHIEFTD